MNLLARAFHVLLSPDEPMDDAEIVRRYVETRDPDLFTLLVERYSARVHRLIAGVLGPARAHEAEEVAQEVFVTVYRKLPGFRLESRFGTWLYRIAYNRAIDRRRMPRLRLDHVSEDALVDLPGPAAAEPLAGFEEQEKRETIQACMDQLPELYRSVLHLHYWLDSSTAEMAAMLGVAEGTVKSYLHRARRALHARMVKRGVLHG